jgi:hypothetical protein
MIYSFRTKVSIHERNQLKGFGSASEGITRCDEVVDVFQ